MIEEETNLHYVIAQTLLWIQGVSSLRFDINKARIIRTETDGKMHYSFNVKTNTMRLDRITHPLALVIKTTHVAITGSLSDDTGDRFSLNEDEQDIEIEDMPDLILKKDNGGYSSVAVQTKFNHVKGDEYIATRHFMFINNMLYQIR